MKDLDVVEVPDVSDWKGWGMLLQAGTVQPFVVMVGLGRLESQGCSGEEGSQGHSMSLNYLYMA
jgi:hypothetical protein